MAAPVAATTVPQPSSGGSPEPSNLAMCNATPARDGPHPPSPKPPTATHAITISAAIVPSPINIATPPAPSNDLPRQPSPPISEAPQAALGDPHESTTPNVRLHSHVLVPASFFTTCLNILAPYNAARPQGPCRHLLNTKLQELVDTILEAQAAVQLPPAALLSRPISTSDALAHIKTKLDTIGIQLSQTAPTVLSSALGLEMTQWPALGVPRASRMPLLQAPHTPRRTPGSLDPQQRSTRRCPSALPLPTPLTTRTLCVTVKMSGLPPDHPGRTKSTGALLHRFDRPIHQSTGCRPLSISRLTSGDLAVNLATQAHIREVHDKADSWLANAFDGLQPLPSIARPRFTPTHSLVVHGVSCELPLQEAVTDAMLRNEIDILDS